MNIQWFPGHMAKTKRLLAEKLKIVDMVVIVTDARAPKSTRNPDFDELLKDKIKLYVLNKSDLAHADITKQWIKTFREAGENILQFSSVSDKPQKLLEEIGAAVEDIKQKYLKKGMNKTIRAMVIGIPNVGKSALLNRLAGQKKLKEGNKPGVTRGLQWVKLSPYLELMDTPGVLAPKLNDPQTAIIIAVLGSVKEEILNIEELALHFIELLTAACPDALSKRFGIELQGAPIEILESICKKRGFLVSKGEYDLERGARTLLDEFQLGKLGRISLEKP